MAVSTVALGHSTAWDVAEIPIAPNEAKRADVLAKLQQWFSTEFHLFDGATGGLVHCAQGRTPGDWEMRGRLCRAVAERGEVAFIEDDEPLLTMAVPIYGECGASLVAVGSFVTSHAVSEAQLARAAESLGLDTEAARDWIARQTCWVGDMLLRVGQLAANQLAVERRLATVEGEVRELSNHLAANYEEISLLYRLTQNLKLSSKVQELASLALDWLSDVLPADSLAVHFLQPPGAAPDGAADPGGPLVVTRGNYPIELQDLKAILAQYEASPVQRPLIINDHTTQESFWRWPAVRQLIVVQLGDAEGCYGWLVACNHRQNREFGTVEAIMLSSVAAILGIHTSNRQLYEDQQELFSGIVRALTSAIDAKDPYTCGHSDRVARVAKRLAQEMGCDQKQMDTIYLSGLLHDVGKIGVDDDVLRKPGKLTEAEYDHIKTHAEIGFRILSDIRQLDQVLPVVLHHHEQWDGKGYPRGLAGHGIPLLARIVAVADAFDAMGSDRPYRAGMSDEKLDSIMREGAGTQWDAEVVAAFFRARDAIRQIAHEEQPDSPMEIRG